MALIKDRDTQRRDGVDLVFPAAASVRIFAGAIVGLNAAGNAVPAGTAGTVCVVGIAQATVDNRTGQIGDENVSVRRGVFALKAAAAGITRAAYGKPVKAVDDESVALIPSEEAATAIVAGVLRHVDDSGVWVQF